MPTFRTAYDGVRVRVGFDNTDDEGNPLPSRVQQSQTAMTDINNIIKRFDKTGLLDHVNRAVAQYGDFTEVNEFQEALNLVNNAQTAFDDLPSHIRKRFNHDPGEFFEFATNPANAQEMYDLGLAEKPQPDPLISAVEAVTEAVVASSTGGTDAS